MNPFLLRLFSPLLLLTLSLLPSQANASFSGSIAAPDAGGIHTTGGTWLNNPDVTLSWTITENVDGSWHYSYTFTTPTQGGLSHIIIELSDSITGISSSSDPNKIFNLQVVGGTNSPIVGTFGSAPSNPGIPGSLYGLKVDTDSTGTSTTISFDVFRAPTWGDFYAKDGKVGGSDNAAWNTGFVAGEAAGLGGVGSNDPINIDPHDGPEWAGGVAHILVPDTVITTVIPNPPTVILAGIGGICFGIRQLRNRRKKVAV